VRSGVNITVVRCEFTVYEHVQTNAMASSTPLDPYSMKKTGIFNQMATLKSLAFRPTPVCDSTKR
jgi:hypothetical protein